MRAAQQIMRGMTILMFTIGAASAAAAEPRGTLEGFHAVAQVSRDEYVAVHNDLLYTHDGDDRLFFENEHNLALLNIYDLLARYGLNPTIEPFTFYNYPAWNVYGELIGTTRPDEIYIIGAHYDTYASDNPEVNGSPGADDNATGVAAVLEIARLISQWQSEATIRFIAFDREEFGLFGADAHARAHSTEDIRGMLSLDMLAYRETLHNYVEIAGRPTSGAVKAALTAALADYAGLEAIDIGTADHSDHAPFEWQGFQAALLGEPNPYANPHIHRSHDSLDIGGYIDYDYALLMTRAVMGWLVESAGITPGHPAGDMNCDAAVDGADINPFVTALTNPAAYAAAYPDCHRANADFNGDGQVDFQDITPFTALFFDRCNGPQAVAKLWVADAPNDYLGTSVALGADLAAVGSNADMLGNLSGSVVLYTPNAGTWVQIARLTSPAGGSEDFFGRAVALDGATLLVGASGDSEVAPYAGAVYVFEPSGADWLPTGKLTADDGAFADLFGQAIAIRGDVAVVGAPACDGAALDVGSAYVFERVAGVWTQTAKLTPPAGADYDAFGSAVAVDGNTVVVGAIGDSGIGAAYVFERDGTAWVQTARLLSEDGIGGDQFGRAVGIDGDTIVIGAYHTSAGSGRTMAYVFERSGGVWPQWGARLGTWSRTPGTSVAIEGQTIVVGRSGGDLPPNAGQACVFQPIEGVWTQVGSCAAWDGVSAACFGSAVAVHGDTVLVGAMLHFQAPTGNGAAYVFNLNGDGTPRVLESPGDLTVTAGEAATFSVTAVGPQSPTYRWRKNGQRLVDDGRISGATTGTLTINPVNAADVGVYDVVLSSYCGAATSTGATLTVMRGAP